VELLYFIDRTITHALQTLAHRLERRRMPLYVQRWFISIFLYMLGVTYVSSIGKDNPASLTDFLLYLTAIVSYLFVSFGFAAILMQLHTFFDKEGATAKDQIYENGYKCWGDVVTTVLYIGMGASIAPKILSANLIEAGMFQLGMIGYLDFVVRRKGTGNKRKKGVTAALQALLERCKDFIPRPIPEGASSVVLENISYKGEIGE